MSNIWEISFQSRKIDVITNEPDCLEPVRGLSELTTVKPGMCVAFYESARRAVARRAA